MPVNDCRVLVFGAHPDDAEIYAGGLMVRHRQLGHTVRIISVTDGRSGHYRVPPDELVAIRRDEARQAGQSIGAEYWTLDFPDGSLLPDLATREAIIRHIREFKPDLVLTHRLNDYHPDHRAVGQAVQDASYMITVPHVCPDVPALKSEPVVAYMCDLFTRPNRLRADIVLNIDAEFDRVLHMAACHTSQFFEWLPYHDGLIDQVPADHDQRVAMLDRWLRTWMNRRRDHFAEELKHVGAEACQLIEVYEISEYARPLNFSDRATLFPGYLAP